MAINMFTFLGVRQDWLRQRVLIPSFGGSNPSPPENFRKGSGFMLTGWVLWVIITNGTGVSTQSVHYGFLSETECKQIASQSVATKDRWICFNTGR